MIATIRDLPARHVFAAFETKNPRTDEPGGGACQADALSCSADRCRGRRYGT